MKVTRDWRLAFRIAVVASLVMTLAFVGYNSQSSLGVGGMGELCRLVAEPGFLGFVAGMFASGNAHVGGPDTVVLVVATIFNTGLYMLVVYGIIRMGKLRFR